MTEEVTKEELWRVLAVLMDIVNDHTDHKDFRCRRDCAGREGGVCGCGAKERGAAKFRASELLDRTVSDRVNRALEGARAVRSDVGYAQFDRMQEVERRVGARLMRGRAVGVARVAGAEDLAAKIEALSLEDKP